MTFNGHGRDSDGDAITVYSWRSNLLGNPLSDQASFSSSTLAEGNHIIYFKVKDDKEAWSSEVNRTHQVSSQTSNILACHSSLFDTVLAALPRVMVVSMREGPGAEWLTSSIRFSIAESAAQRAGAGTVLLWSPWGTEVRPAVFSLQQLTEMPGAEINPDNVAPVVHCSSP